ncbi:peroxisomal biogenesis factor 11 [Gamsiella multidivaricata]|uniref:peroxisomal biogenesis factor 11 n=1 Tax=Gamsiella multidivaricata TaxID=101098 RepID=UPI0022201EF0|nr:peroxisomal biogenesis factor 11 [Gamsiella multidivaricata]KAG0357594.1 hypothetical protein BGZ54_000273 [Gamsiella multidivaricata]KAI7815839.1 peroxisomal biogenesis factor 11 [Gamsiella multidivaricata]
MVAASKQETEEVHTPVLRKESPSILALGKLFPQSKTLDHTVRFLSQVRGTDKTLMVVQYFSKIFIWYFLKRGRESTAQRVKNLAGPISDFRILLRYYGLLPLIQWMQYVDTQPSPSPLLLLIDRLQNICNLIYYPLEHIYWLGAHEVIPISMEKTNKIAIWSCRFWAAYVVLQFVHLAEEFRLHKTRLQSIQGQIKAADKKAKETGEPADKTVYKTELAALRAEKKGIIINTIINTGYLPLTVHWSLEKSSFPDVGVGIFGGIAAAAQFYVAWKSS